MSQNSLIFKGNCQLLIFSKNPTTGSGLIRRLRGCVANEKPGQTRRICGTFVGTDLPDSVIPETPTSVIPACFWLESLLARYTGKSLPTTCRDDKWGGLQGYRMGKSEEMSVWEDRSTEPVAGSILGHCLILHHLSIENSTERKSVVLFSE
jgi:hypothetical protein